MHHSSQAHLPVQLQPQHQAAAMLHKQAVAQAVVIPAAVAVVAVASHPSLKQFMHPLGMPMDPKQAMD